jgi:site-specific recombinase XerD
MVHHTRFRPGQRRSEEWLAAASLSSSADAYVQYLTERGYAAESIKGYFRSVAHFAHWLTQRGFRARDIRESLIDRFLDRHLPGCRCARQCWRARSEVRAALRQFLKMLRIGGVCPEKASTIPAAIAAELEDFDLTALYNTGARVSELIGMRISDLTLEPTAWVRIRGKGRKERSVPLWSDTARELKRWLRQYPRAPEQPLFPSRCGGPLTRIGLTERLKLAVQGAAQRFPELAKRRVFPHLVRHSVALHMLQSGVDITVIALWLGHESPVTTHRYVEADLAMKDRALKALQAPSCGPVRYRPKDDVLRFLQGL